MGTSLTTVEEIEFERFVDVSSPGLLRSAYLLTGDHGLAEDLLQLALIRALGRWRQIDGSPAGYVFAVLSNLARDRVRDERRRPRLAFGHELPERTGGDSVDELLRREAILAAARRLPGAQREVLACRFLLELSVAETAATLSLPEGTVKSHTSRALARMRELLGDDQRTIAVEVRHDH